MKNLYPFINCFLLIFNFMVNGAFAQEQVLSVKPNFIIILTDDQGYNDVGVFGSKKIKTPNLDQMADGGIKLTSFYTGAPLCGPSRASLMTGCYPQRVAEPDNKKRYHTILHEKELTIAEMLKTAGYATMAIGKWHLAGSGKGAIGIKEDKQGLEKFYRIAHLSFINKLIIGSLLAGGSPFC